MEELIKEVERWTGRVSAKARREIERVLTSKGTISASEAIKINRKTMKKPKMMICHANSKHTGAAMTVTLTPATEYVDGYITLSIAGQKPTLEPFFYWDNAMHIDLNWLDLAKVIQVFRGECESVNDGAGLFVRYDLGSVNLKVDHVVSPVQGYRFMISDNKGFNVIMLTSAEAIGFLTAIECSYSRIVFGD